MPSPHHLQPSAPICARAASDRASSAEDASRLETLIRLLHGFLLLRHYGVGDILTLDTLTWDVKLETCMH